MRGAGPIDSRAMTIALLIAGGVVLVLLGFVGGLWIGYDWGMRDVEERRQF